MIIRFEQEESRDSKQCNLKSSGKIELFSFAESKTY